MFGIFVEVDISENYSYVPKLLQNRFSQSSGQ